MKAFVLFAHGSQVHQANESVRALAAELEAAGGFTVVAAFLGGAAPDLAGAVHELTARGADRIIVLPYFLTLGGHVRDDLPRLAREIESQDPDLVIEIAPPLDGHPALMTALLDRAAEFAPERSAAV